jgi:hypothetical protein
MHACLHRCTMILPCPALPAPTCQKSSLNLLHADSRGQHSCMNARLVWFVSSPPQRPHSRTCTTKDACAARAKRLLAAVNLRWVKIRDGYLPYPEPYPMGTYRVQQYSLKQQYCCCFNPEVMMHTWP